MSRDESEVNNCVYAFLKLVLWRKSCRVFESDTVWGVRKGLSEEMPFDTWKVWLWVGYNIYCVTLCWQWLNTTFLLGNARRNLAYSTSGGFFLFYCWTNFYKKMVNEVSFPSLFSFFWSQLQSLTYDDPELFRKGKSNAHIQKSCASPRWGFILLVMCSSYLMPFLEPSEIQVTVV